MLQILFSLLCVKYILFRVREAFDSKGIITNHHYEIKTHENPVNLFLVYWEGFHVFFHDFFMEQFPRFFMGLIHEKTMKNAMKILSISLQHYYNMWTSLYMTSKFLSWARVAKNKNHITEKIFQSQIYIYFSFIFSFIVKTNNLYLEKNNLHKE